MWPSIITIDNFLGEQDLETIHESIDAAGFTDGSVSAGGGNLAVKNNQEMVPEQQYIAIIKLVERALKTNVELNYAIFPRAISRAIVSRYDEGMSYGVHIDSPVMGFMTQDLALGPFGQNYLRSDFSMTVFLSEPDSYEGGQLRMASPWGDHSYKLPIGSAIIYPTGMPHEVTAVTRGSRLAAVLWLQSMIRDEAQRRLVSEISSLARDLTQQQPGSPLASRARDLAANALRLAAEV